MNSDKQSPKAVDREQEENVLGQSEAWQIVASSVLLIVVAVGVLVGLTHLMLPQWLTAMNDSRQAVPGVIQHLMSFHHMVLTHWRAAIIALITFGAVASIFLRDATGKTNV